MTEQSCGSLFNIFKLQREVFNCAKDGDLEEIKNILDALPENTRKKVASGRVNNVTPLLACCRYGQYAVASYFLEYCYIDVEATGSVVFDGENIEEAPPLWCASAAGFTNIVKLLVYHKADVNKTTKTNSTPLRAACFDGHKEIVRYLVECGADIEIANRHGHTCLMIACYKGHYAITKYLVEKGADINRRSVKGNTALHDCAESGSLRILKLLLEHGANQDVDSYGLTPLLAASVSGHSHIVEYLIRDCNPSQKVDALELLGATYVDKKRDMSGAISLWRRAIEEHTNSKVDIRRKTRNANIVLEYENATELRSLEELDELMSDPDRIKMQALLIRERILGPAHPDASYYIRYRGAVYADNGNFDKCIRLWMYALRMQQKFLEPLSPLTQSSLLSFAELFSFTLSDSWSQRNRFRNSDMYKITFSHVLDVFYHAVEEIKRGCDTFNRIPKGERDSSNLNRMMVIMLHLVCLLSNLIHTATAEQEHSFMKYLYEIVKMDPKGRNGASLLHLACHCDTSLVGRHPVCAFPSVNVVNVLLEVGASTTSIDYDHNTPLHTIVFSKPVNNAIVNALLENGAHIDAINLNHNSPLQVIKRDKHVRVDTMKYLRLSCLAAQVISTHMLPYKQFVSQQLASFVQFH